MSVFRAVNTTGPVSDAAVATHGDAMTPTTPTPNRLFQPEAPSQSSQPSDDAMAKTPTRDSFHGISGQRPLPDAPYTPPQEERRETPASEPARPYVSMEGSHKSTKSLDSQDIDMHDDDVDEDGSDNESMNSDSTRPAKKKKGQRFFCTEFPPCQLSFTRSEHLARHIRKHTGERPFQCHCSRRFSRLDNLRQHAQTVHVNEDIPGDSLAATGTRFQRQIRTDRVRPPPSRSRASTLSTSGPQHRAGHSRNLSTSSIASTVSTMSTVSHVSQPDEFHRRPTALAMSSGADMPQRQRLSLDTFNPQLLGGSPGPTFYNPPEGRSPSGYSTPPSASYSSATNSPRFSGIQSPISTASRPYSYGGPPSSHNRRLSQPASGGHNPFQPHPPSSAYHQSSFLHPAPSGPGSVLQSNNSSVYASPTSSTFPNLGERPETSAEAEWRRRTWHPTTQTQMRPATSGLSRFESADSPTPERAPTQNATRLPGIESFDHAPPLPALPRVGSPMQLDAPPQQSGDMGLQQGIRRLEIANPDSRNEQRQPHQPSVAEQYQALVMHPNQAPPQLPSLRTHEPIGAPPPVPQRSALRLSAYQPPSLPTPTPQAAHQPVTQYATQAPPNVVRFSDQPPTPRKNKRYGWINGPPPGTSPSQEQFPASSYSPYAQPPPQPPSANTASEPPQQQQTPTQATHSRGSSTNTIRTSPEDSSSSDGVPTPSSSSMSGWNPAVRNSDGYITNGRPSSVEFVSPAPVPAPAATLPAQPQQYQSQSQYLPQQQYQLQYQQPQQQQQQQTYHRPDIASWSLQQAQTESRKRDRDDHTLPHHHHQQRDSGVELGPTTTTTPTGVAAGVGVGAGVGAGAGGAVVGPHVDNGMRRLEALVAVATGESRA